MLKYPLPVRQQNKLDKKQIFWEHNVVKKTNWHEVEHLAIYKSSQGVGLGVTKKQLQIAVKGALHPGPPDDMSHALTKRQTLPPTSSLSFPNVIIILVIITIISGN